ncbi:MAG: hypothetical protein HYV07_09845 [Deltaproteobacteria bacterium]|nr:hypothetical protein [Deltaproteobacteria bacterium]
MRAIATSLVHCLALAGCATDRYVGSLSSDMVWANRGYGLVLPLAELAPRWIAIDPSALDKAAPSDRPIIKDDAIDLDGDGAATFSERTRRLDPALRLLSRTATSATLEVLVELSPVENGPSIEAAATSELVRRGYPASSVEREPGAAESIVARARRAEREARALTVEQPRIVAEEGRVRRQLITIVVEAKSLDASLVADQELARRALIMSAEAAPLMEREAW